MNRSIFRLPENMPPQARNAVLIAGFMAVLITGWIVYTFLKAPQAMEPVFLGTLITIAIVAILAAGLSSKGYVEASMTTLIVSAVAATIAYQLNRTSDSLFNAVLLMVIVVGIAMPTLSGKWVGWAVLIGGVGAVLVLLIDLFGPAGRPVYTLATRDYILVIVLSSVLLYFAFRGFRDYSLRTKLLIAFLAVALIPVGLLVYYMTGTTRQALTTQANAALLGASSEVAGNVDSFIENGIADVHTAVQSHIWRELLALPTAERAGSDSESTAYIDLRALASHDPNIASVGLLDKYGRDVVDTVTSEVGQSKADRDYFKASLKTGEPYASAAEFSQATGVYSIFFSAPVRDENGNIIGVLRIRYNASALQDILLETNDLVGAQSYAVLFDENFLRLGQGNKPELIGKTWVTLDPETFARLQAERRIPADVTAEQISTNQPDFKAGMDTADKQPVFQAYSISAKGTVIYAATKLKNQTWTIIYAQSLKNLYAPIDSQTRNAAVAALILSILVAFAAVFVAQTISRPAVALTHVAGQIAGGDMAAQASVTSQDEIGRLGGAFNNMTARLRKSFEDLDQRAAQLATVAEVGTATSSILETDKLLQQVVDLTKERFNLYHSHIYLLDEEGKNLALASGAGEPGRQMMAKGLSIPVNREQSLVARAARERKGVTVNDVTQAPDFLPNPLLPNTRSELAVPMIVGGNVIGVFDVQSDQVGRFTEADINIQTTLAAQLATSVQNVRSFERAKAQADFEAQVNAIGQKIRRTASMEDALETAIREVGLALGASRVSANIARRQAGDNNASQN